MNDWPIDHYLENIDREQNIMTGPLLENLFYDRNICSIPTNCVRSYITSKRIEIESPGCSGFEANFKSFPTVIYFLKF